MLHVLKDYNPKHDKYVTLKNNLSDNISKFYKGREKIIEGFKNKVFPLYYDSRYHEEWMKYEEKEEKEEEEKQEEKQKPKKDDLIKLNKHSIDEETNINEELFKKYFNFQRPSDMLMLLNTTIDKTKSNDLVVTINSGLKDLKEEIKNMSKKEIKIEKSDEIVRVVEMILKFNKQNQQRKDIKILTPNQMLSRLPITLAQLKAGNNSEKPKNKIRQLLYSFYRSKNMTKQMYNNSIKHI